MASKLKSKDILKFIKDFINDKNRRSVYNEFSLQHELGVFLRNRISKIDKNYKVEFERNISFFELNNKNWPKKEIDIVIYKKQSKDKYAIELKYHPIKCNIPQRMYDSIVDISFMEKLRYAGFKTFVLAISEDQRMWCTYSKNKEKLNIYNFFRRQEEIKGSIENRIRYKTNHRGPKKVEINGNYVIKWNKFFPSTHENEELERMYYINEIKLSLRNKKNKNRQ